MIALKKNRSKDLYKKFVILKVNIKNNNKIFKLKKEKWEIFNTFLKRQNEVYKKARPLTHHPYHVSKFASHGNSFKKNFKNNLLAEKIYKYAYGGYLRKYLKKHTTYFFNRKSSDNPAFSSLSFFESRLDSVLHKSKFCFSVKYARQLISHKHVTVNGVIEKNKTYILKSGDRVNILLKSFYLINKNLLNKYPRLKRKRRREKLKLAIWPIPPTYLLINYKTLEIIFGIIKNFNFSVSFPFKLKVHSIMTNFFRN